MWLDTDMNPLPHEPSKRSVSGLANTADQTALRPISHALTVPVASEALNVNSLDEVPNSSWFTNRIGLHPMTPAEVARGACGETPPLDPARGPWMVVSGKSEGSNRGFVIKAPDGHRYMVKIDGILRSQRQTAADVIGSKIYHAAGFFTPCNEIVHFRSDILKVANNAKHKDRYNRDAPLTLADVHEIIATVPRSPDGLIRASASRYLDGSPIGPFRYEGTRADDPNDVIPHQHRRELRGSKLLAAWIHHWDAIEQNTIDMIVVQEGRRYIRHHLLDWGDALGFVWESEPINRRVGIGRSGYLDLDHVFVDLVTLGLRQRPWHRPPTPDAPETFGYFGTDDFVASAWRGSYRNAAFDQMTTRDGLWASRIIARFTDQHIAAMVAEAKLDDAHAASFLTRTLIARRDMILREYLTRWSPLEKLAIIRKPDGRQALCFDDLAIATGMADARTTVYRVHAHAGRQLETLIGWRITRPGTERPDRTCFDLPLGTVRPHDLAGASASEDDPLRYMVLEIYSNQQPSLRPTATLVAHLYDLGPGRGFRLVGLERPSEVPDPP